jgi:uncharacterized membrane protein SpoIIM required for sporulation
MSAHPSARSPFVVEGEPRWTRLEALLSRPSRAAVDWLELSALHRAVCADLATARSSGEPHDVQAFLDELAARAHGQLYGGSHRLDPSAVLHDALHGFPRELRECGHLFALSTTLFMGPLLIGALAALSDPTFAPSVLPESALESIEAMYANELGRASSDDAAMAGFYVHNNVGIAFRVFATGILFGVGPLFYLVYNGLVIGTVLGHVASVGHGANLGAFVVGHAPWELGGICVAGAAGFRMGWALVATEGRTRLGSLAAAGPSVYRLVLGASVMLLVAAAIEGFWSAGPMPPGVKFGFGIVQLGLVTAWLALGGRGRA